MKFPSTAAAVLLLVFIAVVIFIFVAYIGFAPGSGDEEAEAMIMHFRELRRLEPCVDPKDDHTW